jgi:hypothetical protein
VNVTRFPIKLPRKPSRLVGLMCLVLFASFGAPRAKAEEFDWSPPGLAMAGQDYVNFDQLPAGGDARLRANFYYYFVMGVTHTLFYERHLCAGSIQGAQVATIVSKYLNDHPERWQLPAAQLISEALQPVFPCKAKGK